MNEIEVTITSSGNTFGFMTQTLKILFEELGAKVKLDLDHPSAIMEFEEMVKLDNPFKNKEITIKTNSLPWGG